MAAVLFDSTVLIDILRGRDAAVERLARIKSDGDVSYSCAVNAEELFRGARPQEAAAVAALMGGMLLAPLGFAEGARAGAWRRDFARRGRTLAQADCLIAAAAVGVGARLATGNPKDFPMKGLVVDHWPVG